MMNVTMACVEECGTSSEGGLCSAPAAPAGPPPPPPRALSSTALHLTRLHFLP